MSIRDEIKRRELEGRLFIVTPTVPHVAPRRALFVMPELHQLLIGPWKTDAEEARWNKLKADLDHFVGEGLVNEGYMKPLKPRSDEVWEIKSRAPKPSLRVFGSFADCDVFVATSYERRSFLGAFMSFQWHRSTRRSRALWRQLFPTYDPFSGAIIHDYVSQNSINDYRHWDD